MKLLNLRLSNLNSLYGEWSIDFEHQAYVTNGLFAITGPTGAGKSTILDAISLALYGRTPRLGTISKDTNEIMSRDCGECFAEVTFRSSKGTFRAHWSQRRARSKTIGKLQSPQHELTDAITQRIVTAKKMETLATIQDNVGLDYEQFMRSIMLAQGEFAAFLKSDDSKRASILAKITGTDIYARIGTAVFQRFRTETESLAMIKNQSSAIELLTEEGIRNLDSRVLVIEQKLEEMKASLLTLEGSIRWFERDEQLRQELVGLDQDFQKAKLAADASLSLRSLLARAKRGVPLQRTLEGFRSLQKRIQTAENLLTAKKMELADATTQKEKTFGLLEEAKQERTKLQQSIESLRPLWSMTHDLDLHLANLQSMLDDARTQSKTNEAKRQQFQQEKLDLEKESQASKSMLAQNQAYRKENSIDAELMGLLPKLELLVSHDRSIRQSIEISEKQLVAIHEETSTTQNALRDAKEHLASFNRAILNQQSQIDTIEQRRLTLLDGRSLDQLEAEAVSVRTSQQIALEQVKLTEAILALNDQLLSQLEAQNRLTESIVKHRETHAILEQQLTRQKQLVDALEANHFKDQLIARLHEHRSRLKAGEPCELCGSINHPWAEGSPPSPSSDSEQRLKLTKNDLDRITNDRDESRRQADRNAHLLSQSEETIFSLKNSRHKATQELEEYSTRFSLDSHANATFVASLKESIERWNGDEERVLARIRDAGNLMEQIAKLREEQANLVANRSVGERSLQSLEHLLSNLVESRSRTEQEISQYQDQLHTNHKDLLAIFTHLKMELPSDLVATPKTLQRRSDAWLDAIREMGELEKAILQTDGYIATIEAQNNQLAQEWDGIQETINKRSNEHEALCVQRSDLFGARNPRDEELQLQKLLDQKAADVERLGEAYDPILAAWHLLDRDILQITSSLATDTQQQATLHGQLDVDLQLAGFVDLRDLESAMQQASDIDEWERQLRSIDETSNAANIRLSQKKSEVEAWEQNRPNDSSLELLRQQLTDTDCAMEALRLEQVELRHRLSENQTKANQLQHALLRMEKQQQQLKRWGALNELIGSADGAKFRRFAQGITFEFLLEHANIQLRKLTDRYLLKKDEEGLGMVVVDHYQSSRPRSAANLSGGETFLVSLALALGLSKLASQNVQIDSLFLDEGFGSLDEETLEEALHTLSNLRQEGKLVGLISHVTALTQQIPVRIGVIKGSLGKSRLTGPGVTCRGSVAS